ncbi:RNA dependent RNA polymerase [Plasmopara viticola lesion associated ourmia-like virus 63]|uniref:RNA dependent RNA polymerase n=1 Tax=Plasmopara viticola lesion associated ourmia-like virus 63 TaxID=2686535 RepID=A0ABX6FQ92_9VIRU|nr:RNA dependent RNA polymerase [Plasmopara viticola lesion associated ourmia-like virus 63]QGY72593.1 RNA dependent RNA polymerase [Plasmopara viticola lesion associated ourmia-like virus 63]
MTDTSYYKNNRYSSVLYLPKGTPRPCRDFMARTTLVVQRATSSVRRIHPGVYPTFCPSRIHTCADLLKQLKAFLSVELDGASQEAQMAFQSIKKLLPASCKCLKHGMLGDLRVRLSRPPPSLPVGYLSFARKVSAEIFTKGWDFRWGSKVSTFSPSLGSCIGQSRKHGGQLSQLAPAGQQAWQESLNLPLPGSLEGELLLVDSSGKPRPLTRFVSEAATLRPLHGLLYDTLSKQPWLLRGEITADKLRNAGFNRARDEPLTSGDYKSATDNLSIEVAETILDVAWSSAKHVPASVFRYALAAQRPSLSYEDDEGLISTFVPTRGQMMGSYLCFPLLCLQNYIAFRYAEYVSGVEGTPVLINGDDILFQSELSFSKGWMKIVGDLGLEVEPTKTSVSTEYGSLNSTLLRWAPHGLDVVKTIRMGMLREVTHPANLGTTALLFARVGPRKTWLLNFEEFLSWHAKTIYRWRCVASDMGFTGRLALRAWSRFRGGRLLWRDDVLHQMKIDRLPAAHCPHNIVMGSEEFVTVPDDSVSKELKRDTAVWMASRKWELGREYTVRKQGKVVSERANATRIPNLLQSWKTPARELKEASSEVMRRREYYWAHKVNVPIGFPARGLLPRDRPSVSSWRWAPLRRTWWQDSVRREGVRIPRVLWEELNPPLDPFAREDLVGDLLKQRDGGVFSSAYSALAFKSAFKDLSDNYFV